MAGRKITIEFLGKDSTGKTTSAVEQKFGKLGSKLDRVGQVAGKTLAGGLILGATAAVKLGQKASDLAETQSKVAQVFGTESTAALDKFAAGAAKSLGQSKQTALDGAATFGIIGKSAGLAGQDLVKFSTDMVELAGDMASFNNASPEEAIEAIGAGMRGEAEPLRRFGVLLDDATLRAEAMKLGLIKTTKEGLTPQQKALAAQAAILRQTKDQQGDFARTSDGLANKQRMLKAQLENMGTSLGTKVLPAMLKGAEVAEKFATFIDKNQTSVGILVAVLGTFTAGLWLASLAMRALAIATAMNPIGLVVIAIAAVVAGLVVAYKKFEWFRKGVDFVFKAIVGYARFMWNNVYQPIFRFLVMGLGKVMVMWGKFLQVLGKVPGFEWAKAAGDKMVKAGQKAQGLADKIRKIPSKKDIRFQTNADSVRRSIEKLNAASRAGKGRNIRYSNGYGGGQKAYAKGTNYASGGDSLVGEEGPEIVRLPRGSKVIPNHKLSSAMNGGGGGGDIHLHFAFHGIIDSDATKIQQVLLRKKRQIGQELGIA